MGERERSEQEYEGAAAFRLSWARSKKKALLRQKAGRIEGCYPSPMGSLEEEGAEAGQISGCRPNKPPQMFRSHTSRARSHILRSHTSRARSHRLLI
jgi:hypothetical protein